MGQNASRTAKSSSGIGTNTSSSSNTSSNTSCSSASNAFHGSKFLPKVLLLHSNTSKTHYSCDDGQSRETVSTGQLTPPSPLGSSSSTFGASDKKNDPHNNNNNNNNHHHESCDCCQKRSSGSDCNSNPNSNSNYAIHEKHNQDSKNANSNSNQNSGFNWNLPNARTLLPRGESDPNLSPTRKQYGYGFPPNQQYPQHLIRLPPPHHHQQQQLQQQPNPHPGFLLRTDKRSNPVKFPRRRQTICGDGTGDPELSRARTAMHRAAVSPRTPGTAQNQDALYLERMYDSRTWEMYRRITNHREKVEAFHAANAAAEKERRGHEDRHSATNETTVSEPALRRVPRAETMARPWVASQNANRNEQGANANTDRNPNTGEGAEPVPTYRGEDGDCYDHHVDHDDNRGSSPHEGEDWIHYSSPLSQDHSAPPYHHQHTHYFDSGRQHLLANTANHHHHHHHYHSNNHNHNNEHYSEWEHMNGDVEDEDVHASGEFGSDPTIFLFDF